MKRFLFLSLVLLSCFLSFSKISFAATDDPKVVGPTSDIPEADSTLYDIESDEEISSMVKPIADIMRAPRKSKGLSTSTPMSTESMLFDFEDSKKKALKAESNLLPGGHMKMSGKYRVTGAVSDEHQFFINDANADLQERNFRYLFGERLNNTYDPAVYSQYLLNIDLSPADKWNIYAQLVADPWSWVGTTGEQTTVGSTAPHINVRYNLKYFGAFNSTLNEIYRTAYTDAIAFPLIKIHDGHLTNGTVVQGFDDYDGVPGNGQGLPFNIPEHDIDYEFHPVRKLWVDYNEDQWHVRGFMFADQSQALTTDDPLELSNHKDYWQQSPWLYQYEPIQFFTDHSFKRGYYSDTLSYLARDSEGNRLVLLRGASFEGDFGKTYVAATVASLSRAR